MAKSRKDLFEEQLQDLQKDISSLNQKLSLTSSSTNHSNETNKGKKETSKEEPQITHETHRLPNSVEKGITVERLRHDLHISNKERDDAVYRLGQANIEIEQLRKGLQEYSRLKASYEHLKQDNDSVRISLESSERIRKQQKELIALLQRSHAMSANHLATATDGSSVVSGASDSFMSSIVPSDDLRNRTHSLGSDTFTSFTSSANANNPIDTYDQKYGASNIGASAVSAKSARRKFKTSQQQQQQSSLSTFVPTAVRSASAPPSVATPQSKLHVSGASKRVKSRSTKHKPPQQSQHTVPPSSGTYSNSTVRQSSLSLQHQLFYQQQQQLQSHQHPQWLASEQQQQQQQLSGLNNLSYQSILQQNSSLVPPAVMSAALETSYLSAGSSGNAALNNSSYSRDSYHNPVVGQFVGSQGHTYHQSPSPQHTALSGGPGRPPRHPSSSTPENTFSGPPPPPSSAARRVGQPSGGAPVSLQARVDTWTQPTASPYSLPAYDRSGSRAKGYTPPPTHSRVSGSAKSSSVRSNKTKSSRLALSTATPPSSARKIHVPVPSPATTFGASQRRF